ncbi:ABC transporter ATP-binding protein [Solwaraspora sp. WMMB335]|uniref:ABC transporter ATP-binding protein n=1 Tax=Solwaraspora sp. WMMB335 TaxID=3404118 RepID=UPI003B941BA9
MSNPAQRSSSPSLLRNRTLLRRIAVSARPYRGRIVVLLAFVLLGTVLPLSQPVLLREVIDELTVGAGFRAVLWPLVLIGVTGLFGVGAGFAASRVADAIGHSVTRDLQRRLFDHLVGMPMPFYTTVRPGTLVSRLTNDVYAVEPLFTSVIATALSSSVTLVIAGVVLIVIDPRLAVVLLIVPLVLWPVRLAESKINTVIRWSFRHNAELSSHVEAVLNRDGVLLARQSGALEAERSRFGELAANVRDTALRLASWRAAVGSSYELVFTVATTALLVGGALLVTGGDITLGTLILFLLYLRQIQAPVSTLIGLRYPAFRAGAAFTRVFDVLDSPLRPIADPPPPAVAGTAGDAGASGAASSGAASSGGPDAGAAGVGAGRRPVLQMCGVGFDHVPAAEVSISGLSHETTVTGPGMFGMNAIPHAMPTTPDDLPEGHRRILDGLDLEVCQGETIAIVGESGAGKSTIALLAAGLITPTRGEIRLNGRSVDELSLTEIARSVALITQETYIRHETIAENLRYVAPRATDEDLVAACRAAQLHELIMSLPDGYQTLVGEKGYRFSGGERQRLSIARALLKRADLVILDEPTSQLDAQTEDQLNAALADIFADTAVLLMAHRLRTVRTADRILVLSGGVIQESGSHDELMSVPGGRYAMLCRMQDDNGRPAVPAPR